jgi:RNA polymerase sigma-70 factor
MPETPDLAATFLAHAKVRLAPPSDAASLNNLLTRVWESARAQWPAVKLDPGLFMQHLAERLPREEAARALEALLSQVAVGDLYLACACLHDVPLAIETFEQHYLRKLPKLLRDYERSAAAIDEICQLTRVKLLVPTAEGLPKIGEYKGKGALMNWVGITAVRIAAKERLRQKPADSLDDPDGPIIDPVLPAMDPELDRIRRLHQEDLRDAMRKAIASLTDEDRYLLRLHYVDGLSTYKMASLLGKSQPTTHRWLAQSQEKLRKETRRLMQDRLQMSQPEFQSIIKLLYSRFELSLSQLLGKAAAPGQLPDSH